MSTNAYLFTRDTATITANGRTEQVKRSSVEFDEVVAALTAGDFDAAFAAFDKAEAIRKQSNGAFQVINGVVFSNGVPVHNVITGRILEFSNSRLPFNPLVLFLENIEQNPSKRAVDESYPFLENENMPITLDGCFIGYKAVQHNYLSKTAGREDVEVSTDGGKTFKVYRGNIPNNVGNIVRMKRNLVDDDKDRHCSYGLHVGALKYAGPNGWFHSSGDKCVLVKVNPKDIVSVPSDHNAQKLRVCEYEVVAEYSDALTQPLATKNAIPLNNKQTAEFRCRDCRGRKKASTFTAESGKRNKCPRCGSNRTFKL